MADLRKLVPPTLPVPVPVSFIESVFDIFGIILILVGQSTVIEDDKKNVIIEYVNGYARTWCMVCVEYFFDSKFSRLLMANQSGGAHRN